MRKIYITLFFFLLSLVAFSQKASVTGKVIDAQTKEPVVGVAVVADEKNGVITDVNGNFILELDPGAYTIVFQIIGYASEDKKVNLKQGTIESINISLVPSSSMLDEMVVSAGKFEQKLSDVTVSIQMIKPSMIENNNTNSIEQIIDKTPGVSIMDDQASIRGGSGYSYGAGSRVLLLVDDLPMLSGDAGDVKWNFAPVENIEQIEIIKGAASALYGSSALNGIINIRTSFPGNTPRTKIIFNSGLYTNPLRKELIWWGTAQPVFAGTQFLHSRKIGNFDLTLGANLFTDQGYRLKDDEQRYRFNINTRYRDKKVKGLSYGVNVNIMNFKGDEFILWKNADSAYLPSDLWTQQINNSRLNVDPFIVYFNEKGNKHSLKTRYYQINNKNNTEQSSRSYLYYGEYQYQRKFKKDLTVTSGLTGTYNYAIADIYGDKNHYAANGGAFIQADKKINLLTISAGARYDIFKMDEDKDESKPVFRTGLNYQLAEATFIRGSFGQGFRYPAIAEKYISTSAGALHLFPNDTLRPEQGWSAELGIKQGFKVSSWYGYLDIAGFWTQYHDMIEFTYGIYLPDSITSPTLQDYTDYLGFKAYNISNAQINGIDVTIMGQGKFFGLPATLLLGYTYTNPIDLDVNRDSLKSTKDNILKYRYYHSVKGDFEVEYNKFAIGVSMDFHSFMINIDKAFVEPISINGYPIVQNGDTLFFLPGLKQYREKHNTGDVVFDCRISYQVTETSKLALIVKNVFNKEYMLRPGDIQPPRNVALQYSLKF